MIKSAYFQFVNFVQGLSPLVFFTIVLGLFALCLVLVIRFFKEYNGTQKNFVKISRIVLAVIIFAIIIYLTYIRK